MLLLQKQQLSCQTMNGCPDKWLQIWSTILFLKLKLNDCIFVRSVVNMKQHFARQNYLIFKCIHFSEKGDFSRSCPAALALVWHNCCTTPGMHSSWPFNRYDFNTCNDKGLVARFEDTLHFLLRPCDESVIVLSHFCLNRNQDGIGSHKQCNIFLV